jgi:hypothetical protein
LSWSGAGHVLPGPETTVDVCGQLAAAGWSTIGIENRITKFFGLRLIYGLTHASRVGIQCFTSGVSLATLKILARCFRSCTSPESCHLKYFDFLEEIK